MFPLQFSTNWKRDVEVRQMEIKVSALRTMLKSMGKHCSSELQSYSLGHGKGSAGMRSPEQVPSASRDIHKRERAGANHSLIPSLRLTNRTKQ